MCLAFHLQQASGSDFLIILQDDTARFRNEDSMDNLMNFSQGFSATQFEVSLLPDWFSPF